jgi:hypothetical protein
LDIAKPQQGSLMLGYRTLDEFPASAVRILDSFHGTHLLSKGFHIYRRTLKGKYRIGAIFFEKSGYGYHSQMRKPHH